jgi:hypothetical protein
MIRAGTKIRQDQTMCPQLTYLAAAAACMYHDGIGNGVRISVCIKLKWKQSEGNGNEVNGMEDKEQRRKKITSKKLRPQSVSLVDELDPFSQLSMITPLEARSLFTSSSSSS